MKYLGTTDLGQLSARVALDKVDFSRNLAQLKRELNTAKTDFQLAGKGIHGFGENVTSGAAQLKTLERQLGLNQQKLKRYSDDYAKAANDIAGSDQVTSKAMQSAQNNFAKTQLEIAQLTEQYKKLYIENAKAESSFYKFNEASNKMFTHMEKGGKAVAKFGDQWTKVGIVIGGATGLILKQFIDWESSVASMEKTIDGTPQEIDALATSFRSMSKEIPVSASQLNELAGVAGQLGIKKESIVGFTRVMADLGVTTNVSSEEAASSLAQLANITGMNQEKFSNLGSSIVALGNNFATTEADIISMSQRLAGAGKQVGLSESEIVGISAALSSLGIEAEQGGSAFSKLMINMNLATEKGGDDLEAFANVAGMSAEQFKTAFQDNAVTAIAAFVDGLGDASEHGETAIGILDEMGISEVRLRDTLLRVGNAQGLFTEAVGMSNQAWDENTALTTEANLRYETTASKIQIAKNEIQDMAIELGAELMPAIADLAQSARPIVETMTSWVKAFADSSDETKKLVTSIIGISIAGGPVLSVIGRLTQGIGMFGKGITSGVGKLFEYKKGLEATKAITELTKGSITGLTTGVAEGTTGLGLMGASASGVTGTLLSLAPAILGVTAVVAIGYGAWKIWGEKAMEAGERTRKWGTDIGENADKALTNFQNLGSEASIATLTMAQDVQKGAQNAMDSYSEMAQQIVEDTGKTISETQEQLATLPKEVQEIVGEALSAHIDEQQKIIDETQTVNEKINGIYANAMEENRELTSNELTIVEEYHNRLAELRSESLELSAEEQRKVHAVMADDLKSFSEEQLITRQQMLHEETESIKKSYDEQAEMLEEQLTSGVLSRQEYNDAISALNAAEKEDLLTYAAEYVKIWNERETPIEGQIAVLEKLGMTTEEAMAFIAEQNDTASESYDKLATSSADATEDMRKANESWNNLVLDEKTGEVKTNLTDVIQEASQSEEGWNNLQFILKNAELDTNAKQEIMEALQANGMWWEMDFPTQFADVETNAGTKATEFLRANYDWENIEYSDKMAILNSNSPETVKQALIDTGIWENLSPTQKEMIVATNAGMAAKEALIATNQWDSLSPSEKEMIVTSNSTEEALKGVKAEFTWNGTDFKKKEAKVTTNAPTEIDKGVRSNTTWRGLMFPSKDAKLNTNANITKNSIMDAYNSFNRIKNGQRTFTILTEYKTKGSPSSGSIGSAGGRAAAGRNHFEGGPVILGDGGNNEPFMTPDGDFGVSPNKDTMYDLPKGTKIWRNIEALLSDIPHYANGTINDPIKVGDKVFRQLSDALVPFDRQLPANNSETARESSLATANIEGDTYNIYLTANGRLPKSTIKEMAAEFQKEIKNTNDRKRMSRGEVVTP